MKQSDFLLNITMAIAASLVPKILQPFIPEVEKEIATEVHWEWSPIYQFGMVYLYTEGQISETYFIHEYPKS